MTDAAKIAASLTPAQRKTLSGDGTQLLTEYIVQVRSLSELGLMGSLGHFGRLTDLGRAVAAELEG